MNALTGIGFISPGGGELVLIILVLIMLFGAKDAPRILRKIQDFFDELRRTANSFRHEMMYSDLYQTDPVEDEAEPAEYEEAEYEWYDEAAETKEPEPEPSSAPDLTEPSAPSPAAEEPDEEKTDKPQKPSA